MIRTDETDLLEVNSPGLQGGGESSARQEPIAIIGMACRFPRSNDISDFWRQLAAGESAVVEGPPGSVIGRVGLNIPVDNPSNIAVRYGAFVDDIDQFDAEFFRIAPLEAQMLDPQQRMMLETTWQALEDAAIDPEGLRGSSTGVYAGISNYDYRAMALDSLETAQAAAGLYAVTGNSLNTAIGRVSFALGLEGPSMAIDTACSSSLVSVHQAAAGLQRRETDLAIAGGVHVWMDGPSIELRANAGMLSPTGRCWTFDASADGFVCGEGCGLVVLKRLRDAEADGDRIWAVIRGTAVNQDGASQGLTVPSGSSQERAIEDALVRAGVPPCELDYLETHGTGTVVGDPIEVNAAAAVYGRGREEGNPLLIGSVKTNIGHLGAAAGIAGLIKSVLAMRHGVIPRHLNFRIPNPRIDWDNLPVRVTDTVAEWPAHPGRPSIAGINSFGWSGTNAHVIVEGYGEPAANLGSTVMSPPAGSNVSVGVSLPELSLADLEDRAELEARDTRLLPISGKSHDALRDMASKYLSALDGLVEGVSPESTAAHSVLSDLAWTAATGRSHFSHRAGVMFSDVAELRDKLEELVHDREGDGKSKLWEAPKVAFVFPGGGSQWVGMVEALYKKEPVVRAVLDRCDEILFEERGISLLDVMFGRAGVRANLDDAEWSHPAIFSMEVAVTALWRSVGIEPSVVVGHSLGELAAWHAAGVFGLEEGLHFVTTRGALLNSTRSDGAMAVVFAPAERVTSEVARINAASDDVGVSIAAYNGIQQVISGPSAEVNALTEIFEAEEIKVRRLRHDSASHSALVEPILDDLEEAYIDILADRTAPAVSLLSCTTGKEIGEADIRHTGYWRRHTRNSVRFDRCVDTLADMGVDVVVEVGPHAILGPLVSLIWPGPEDSGGAEEPPVVLSSQLRPPREFEEPTTDTSGGFMGAVAKAYELGLPMRFEGLFNGESRRKVSLPTYPFQRKRHWVQTSNKRRRDAGHPLLGVRHESPRGEVMYETEMFPTDPTWMADHMVYEQVVAPGGIYGAMAVSAGLTVTNAPVAVDEMQTHRALIFESDDPEDPSNNTGRKVQFVMDGSLEASGQKFEIYSKGAGEEGWTLHAEGLLSSGAGGLEESGRVDLDQIRTGLEFKDPQEFYRMRSADAIYLGPSYHTMKAVWASEGESLGELVLQESVDANGTEMHPLLLDGCFQVLSMARQLSGIEQGAVYMPFGWERLWVKGPMPQRVVCHATVNQPASANGTERASSAPPEVITGDLSFYSTDGMLLGGLKGFAVKRATRTALLSAKDGLKDIIYEVVWRDKPLLEGKPPAEFLIDPEKVASEARTFDDHLAKEGVLAEDRAAFLRDLERLSQSYVLKALERLGWERKRGERVSQEELRGRLKIIDDHQRLMGRLLSVLAEAGVLTPSGDGFVVEVVAGHPLPDDDLENPETLADKISAKHSHGAYELALLRRCGASLAEVLQGREDPLGLLFSDEGPSAANLYLKAPASRAANRMLADAVAAVVADFPEDRTVRILEVGAGTGSATAEILPLLPEGRFEYTFTDISAGFFTVAESRLSGGGSAIEHEPLNIELDPVGQGFEAHGYDLIIAANVLHATRDLGETLAHCRDLLAPSGQLLALEGLRRRSWQDITFGMLDGWWRFSDDYRPDHALATPTVWKQALTDVGFSDFGFIGPDNPHFDEHLGPGVIVARGPATIVASPGVWVIAADEGGAGGKLASELASRGQTVVLASALEEGTPEDSGISIANVNATDRESWRSVFEGLPKDVPLKGVVHLAALDGHGALATTEEMAGDATQIMGSALALIQGIIDASAIPTEGVWLVTRGGQVLEQDFVDGSTGEIIGATLWGFGKVMAGEASHLHPRMLDMDPMSGDGVANLVEELLSPDGETHIAYRAGTRLGARLVRSGTEQKRVVLPEGADWKLKYDQDAGLDGLRAESEAPRLLEPGEVRIGVEASGLNFKDMLLSIGALDPGSSIGIEACGRILETASDVSDFSVGDRVVALGFDTFGVETVTRAEMTSHSPPDVSDAALATIPVAFVTARLAFDIAGLRAGERVLVHSGAGGVGLAAVQLAQLAGAKVFATASGPKHDYLRSRGVADVFDSRQTNFSKEILEATNEAGVDVVLNSLTGEGFIEASLSCLKSGGRFVEIGRRDIWSKEKMSEFRPDVCYSILELDSLKRTDPAQPGAALSKIMEHLSAGEVTPLPHTVWPLVEAGSAMNVMRKARHIGKNVLRIPPLAKGAVREDRTYLVTGGMGGIGCEVARWLADNGARTIVLNGRRGPEPEAEEAIRELHERGVEVRVEIADVTDSMVVDDMLTRIDESLPPLGGVIHSVGVLSDGVIEYQTWERFEQVMWPKVLGAWHLHQATKCKELDLFILFSSVTGIVGNAGQSNHAAANAFLDQLASHRRTLGLPAQSIAWGAWSGIGEAEEQRERIERQLAATGAEWMTPQQGIKALNWLVRHDVTNPMVNMVDWSIMAEDAEAPVPFFEELLVKKLPQKRQAKVPAYSTGLMAQFRETPESERRNVLVAFVQEEVKNVMRLGSPPSPTVSFFDLGMDSLMAVELRNRINRAMAGEYTASNTVVFDYPNAAALAGQLSKDLGGLIEVEGTPEKSASPPQRRVHREEEAIAIVGMACRFPGAPDIDSFWRQLEQGRNAVTDGRQDSGSWEGVLGDPGANDPIFRRGAFVDGIDLFDSRFFRISPIEAQMMDPQQRMLLEVSWHALEDASIDPEALRGSRTGVFAGVASGEYRDLLTTRGQDQSYGGTNAAVSVGRVAFALGLEGPAMALDMVCASSLAAIHQGVVSLQRGEVDMALAGGVNSILSSRVTGHLMEMGMLSMDGQCRAFDAAADGFVRGEGCGIVVLKRLSDAEADGDRIWGVVLGTAVNQNGMSAGLMAPNGPAQERVMEDALSRAGVAASDIDYVEAQGVGSQFGDPIELNAVAEVYGKGRDGERPLYVGSVKANIGHLEWASGVASLIKTVLAMRRGVIPRQLHFNNPNPHIDWDRLQVRITAEATNWPICPDRAPLAAVNSFGLSGSNAHVVVMGYEESGADNEHGWPVGAMQSIAAEGQSTNGEELKGRRTRFLPLSGKTPEALRALANHYLEFLDGREGGPSLKQSNNPANLADMVWSAGVGRSHFQHRAGVAFSDVATLREGLMGVADQESGRGAEEVPGSPNVAFALTGKKDCPLGMGRELYETEPVVREVLDRCDEAFIKGWGFPILDLISEEGRNASESTLSQVAIYALECSLAALWRSVGVKPGVVVGHGLGLISAAQVAGVVGLEEGLRLAAKLAELMTMSPSSSKEMPTEGSAITLAGLSLTPPTVTLVNGITGHAIRPGKAVGNEYWGLGRQDVANPADRAEKLADLGVDVVIEIGSGSTMGSGEETWQPPVVLSIGEQALRGGMGFVGSVARAYESGVGIAFKGLFAGEVRRRVALPIYPFQRRRHWVDPPNGEG